MPGRWSAAGRASTFSVNPGQRAMPVNAANDDPEKARRFRDAALPYLDDVYTLARYLLRDASDAEYAVQECYLRALKHFDGYRGPAMKPWLFAILRNVCYTMMRKSRSHETPEPYDEEVHVAAGQEDLREAFRQKANAESLQCALEKLPTEAREIIVLHDLEGLAYKQIASVMGIPIGTVMSRLARARMRLRAEITKSKEASP